jgi:hypothetical protein
MKITLFVLLILCTAAAFGQAAPVISSQPQITAFQEHPLHAQTHSMATETPIVGTDEDAYSYAKGEQPLWQFGSDSRPVPLGDVARAYRYKKSTAKKAEVVLEKQGS